MAVTRRMVLHFPRSLVDQPIMCRLAREYRLDFNILKASVTPDEEGVLVVELTGAEGDFERGMGYLADIGVKTQPLTRDVVRDEERCTHCGCLLYTSPNPRDLSTSRMPSSA